MTSTQQNWWILKYLDFIVPFIQNYICIFGYRQSNSLSISSSVSMNFEIFNLYISHRLLFAVTMPFVDYLHLRFDIYFYNFPKIQKHDICGRTKCKMVFASEGRGFLSLSLCWSSLFIAFTYSQTHSDMKYGYRMNEGYLKCYRIKYLGQVLTAHQHQSEDEIRNIWYDITIRKVFGKNLNH